MDALKSQQELDKYTQDYHYELMVMAKMLTCLPSELRIVLENQLTKIVETSVALRRKIAADFSEAADDMSMAVQYLSFDLEATRRERDAK